MAYRWFERWAWVLFLAPLLFLPIEAFFGIVDRMPPDSNFFQPLTGRSWEDVERTDPGMADYISMAAVSTYVQQVMFAVFMATVAAIPFRRGERWAWFLLAALLPLALLTSTIRFFLYDTNTFSFTAPFAAVIGLGLLLPVRVFFGRKDPGTAPARPGRV